MRNMTYREIHHKKISVDQRDTLLCIEYGKSQLLPEKTTCAKQFKSKRGCLNLDFCDDAFDDHLEAGAEGAIDQKVHRGVHHEQQVAETEQ